MEKFRKRIFGAGILFLMMLLAIGTMVSYAEEGSGSSYKLTIQKVFAEGTPEAAKDMKYTFRVEAQVKGSDVPVERTVRITGEGKETISFNNAFKISVIEQTDDGGFTDADGKEWDVTKTYCESSMHVSASQASVNISKAGGMIEVTRPAGVPDVTFRLTGKPFHGGAETVYQDVLVKAGETKKLGEGLPQGKYTITKLRSADGFSVLVRERSVDVAAGGEGEVHINGSDSELSIKAPDPENGIYRMHHYHISGPVSRDIDVKSGESGTVEHLTEGTYKIKVSETYSGIKGYTVEFPVTTVKEREEMSTALNYDSKRSYTGITVNNAKYVEFYGFGPLYNSSGKIMPESVTYKMNYGVKKPGATGVTRNEVSGTYKSGYNYTLNNPKMLVPGNNYLYFAVTNVSDKAAKTIRVKWREYTEIKRKRTVNKPSEEGDVVEIDSRGWITLSKADDADPLGKKVTYYYTITDSNGADVRNLKDFKVTDSKGNIITDPTDDKDTTVMLKAGESVKISGLHNGNFRIKETIKSVEPMPFKAILKDTTKSVTTPGGSINIEILGERTVEISRPGSSDDDNHRKYTYNIYEVGKKDPIKVITLESGERATVAEQTGSKLPQGKYRIEAADDQIVGFDVTFSDSSSLTSDYICDAAVTFRNHINEVKASYHVIHEYYLKNDDGSYTFEGTSPVYTKNCDGSHNEGDGHYSKDVHQLDVYNGHAYTHIKDGGDAYGKVISWETGGEKKNIDSILLSGDTKVDETYKFVRNGEGNSGIDENNQVRYEYAYLPLTNLKFATAHSHEEADEQGAEIIILRYEREKTQEELGKYNIIHVYYRRTSEGDIWEGNSSLRQVDIGRLTNENRYNTYDADSVEKILRFKPVNQAEEHPYVYDSAVYGRIINAENSGDTGEGIVGAGRRYQKDDTMTSVKATGEGDQIIILRYYRGGGYNVVHEYYYREAANFGESSGNPIEEPEGTPGGETDPIGGNVTGGGDSVSGNDLPNPDGGGEIGSYGAAAPGGALKPGGDAGGMKEPSGGDSGVLNDISGENGSAEEFRTLPGETKADVDSDGNVTQKEKNDVTANDPLNNGSDAGERVSSANLQIPAGGTKTPEESGDSNAETEPDISNGGGMIKGKESDISNNDLSAFNGDSDIYVGDKGTVSGNDPDGETELTACNDEIQVRLGEDGSFSGTLMDSDGYTYEFEGNTEPAPYSADLESRHDDKDVKRENVFKTPDDNQYTYVFKDAVYGYVNKATGVYRAAPYKTGVTATAQEDEIIILRYIRGDGVKEPEEPKIPEEPNPPGGGGGGEDHDPTPPPEELEIPEIPELPVELPDPNDPDSPEKITIWEDGVPRTYVKVWDSGKRVWVYIPEEDVPLWGNPPETGDDSRLGFWVVLAVGSLCGLVWLKFAPQKKDS